MLLNKDGSVRRLTKEERLVCAAGSQEEASWAAQGARIGLLFPLREVKEPRKPFSGRLDDVAQADL